MLRDILLGVGITLIALALILIGADNLTVVEETNLNKKVIINRARELGMFFPGEKNSEELSLNRKTSLETNRVKKSASAVKEELIVVEKNNLSRTEIISRANDMGMFFPWQNSNQNILLNRSNLANEEVIKLEIPSGISSREITDLLVEKGLIKDRSSFIKLLSKFDLENKVMAGTYSFSLPTSPLELLVVLTTD